MPSFIDDELFCGIELLILELNSDNEIINFDLWKSIMFELRELKRKYISQNKLIYMIVSKPEEDNNLYMRKQKEVLLEKINGLSLWKSFEYLCN